MRQGLTNVEVDSANEAKPQTGQFEVNRQLSAASKAYGESEERAQTGDLTE